MRIARFRVPDGRVAQGIVEGDWATLIDGDLLSQWQATSERVRLAEVSLLAPLAPSNIFCIGLNYREHAKESGATIPEHPVLFMKPTSAVIGPNEPIRIPSVCDPAGEVDYECELVAVLGKAARNVQAADALNCVLGYTAANDVSARKWQMHGGAAQWIRGKGFDTFCPLGPVLVTADEIPDPQKLTVKTILNGQTMQEHTTGDMIFSVAQLISFLSQDMTLLPGTIILTGTPQGVGFARKPPVWLKAGDEVVIEVESIGRLVNRVETA